MEKKKCKNQLSATFLLAESETMKDELLVQFADIIKNNGFRVILLIVKDATHDCIKHVDNVPMVYGALHWRPKIVLSSLPWKKILNSL